jgi:hypothetical protein
MYLPVEFIRNASFLSRALDILISYPNLPNLSYIEMVGGERFEPRQIDRVGQSRQCLA